MTPALKLCGLAMCFAWCGCGSKPDPEIVSQGSLMYSVRVWEPGQATPYWADDCKVWYMDSLVIKEVNIPRHHIGEEPDARQAAPEYYRFNDLRSRTGSEYATLFRYCPASDRLFSG